MVRSLALLFLASDIQTSLRNGSRTCGIYALRISRSFLQFHPPATKDRFSDDNPLIRCTLHCFSIFPSLSLSVSIFFFSETETATREYYFRPGHGMCSRVRFSIYSRTTKTRDNFVSKRRKEEWKNGWGKKGEGVNREGILAIKGRLMKRVFFCAFELLTIKNISPVRIHLPLLSLHRRFNEDKGVFRSVNEPLLPSDPSSFFNCRGIACFSPFLTRFELLDRWNLSIWDDFQNFSLHMM